MPSQRSYGTAARFHSRTVIAFSAIGAYVRTVVDEEWPRMREGDNSSQVSVAVDGIFAALQGVEPRSPSAAAFYDDSVRQLNAALAARRNASTMHVAACHG